jgi:putative FmdB family regulatory protein
MPTYNYLCSKCDSTFEKFKAISARREPEEHPCPACGAHNTVKIMIGTPMLNAETGGSLKKAGDGWKEVLSKVKETYTINNIRD